MKRILLFTFTTLLLITLTACGGGSKKTSEELIIGTWEATEPASITESGMTVTFSNMKSVYAKDHTSKSSGILSMAGPGLPAEIKMDLNTTSTWSIEGDKLREKVTNADIKMQTNIPGLPDMGGIIAQQMKSEPAGTATIITLDKKTLVMKEDTTGLTVTMKRK